MALLGDDRGQPQLPVFNENEIFFDMQACEWYSIVTTVSHLAISRLCSIDQDQQYDTHQSYFLQKTGIKCHGIKTSRYYRH
jgi:hypothetical protein